MNCVVKPPEHHTELKWWHHSDTYTSRNGKYWKDHRRQHNFHSAYWSINEAGKKGKQKRSDDDGGGEEEEEKFSCLSHFLPETTEHRELPQVEVKDIQNGSSTRTFHMEKTFLALWRDEHKIGRERVEIVAGRVVSARKDVCVKHHLPSDSPVCTWKSDKRKKYEA